MNLAKATAYSGAFLAGIGTLMLGISEQNYALSAASVVVAVSALVLCDLTGWFRLKTWSSNVAALLALALAVWQYGMLATDARVLALADLLGYLQFVLQFKPKTTRTYWLLTMVSFLQVSVASALHTGPLFAVLLIVYLFGALFFLGVFYLYREESRFDRIAAELRSTTESRRSGLFARPNGSIAPAMMTGDWARRLVNLGLGTVILSALFFAAVPRIGQTNWVPTVIASAPSVGFTPEINLERSGKLLEDPEVVMQVRFVDPESGEPYQIDGPLYLRGTAVYFYSEGRWRTPGPYLPRNEVPKASVSSREGLISQRVTIEPLSSSTVFSCSPSFLEDDNEALQYSSYSGRIERGEHYRLRRFSYDLLTGAFRNHRQVDLVPTTRTPDASQLATLRELPGKKESGEAFTQLKATAAAVTEGIAASDSIGRARALEAYLRDSGRFQYTLDSPARPEGVDPLEDFISNDSRGHCEFFAGALTLMLRSIGIPARVVLGFRGGEWNVMGNFYQIRQLNAHSWVEIYLKPEQVPLERLTTPALSTLAHRDGAWLRLDPTAGDGPLYASTGDSRWGEIQQVVDYLKFLWNNYVLGMDATKQEEAVYQPIVETMKAAFQYFSQGTWRSRLDAVAYYLNPLHWLPENVPLFSWRGGFLIAGLIVTAWGVGFAAYFLWRRMRRSMAAKAERRPRRAAVPIDFYVRLESALGRLKLTRTPEQTQREFVLAACGELAESPATRGVSALPRKIVDAFYRVRFGGRPLDNAERDEVELALSTLTAALQSTELGVSRPPPKLGR